MFGAVPAALGLARRLVCLACPCLPSAERKEEHRGLIASVVRRSCDVDRRVLIPRAPLGSRPVSKAECLQELTEKAVECGSGGALGSYQLLQGETRIREADCTTAGKRVGEPPLLLSA